MSLNVVTQVAEMMLHYATTEEKTSQPKNITTSLEFKGSYCLANHIWASLSLLLSLSLNGIIQLKWRQTIQNKNIFNIFTTWGKLEHTEKKLNFWTYNQHSLCHPSPWICAPIILSLSKLCSSDHKSAVQYMKHFIYHFTILSLLLFGLYRRNPLG